MAFNEAEFLTKSRVVSKLESMKVEQQAERFRDILRPKGFVILPDDPYKIRWDIFMAM